MQINHHLSKRELFSSLYDHMIIFLLQCVRSDLLQDAGCICASVSRQFPWCRDLLCASLSPLSLMSLVWPTKHYSQQMHFHASIVHWVQSKQSCMLNRLFYRLWGKLSDTCYLLKFFIFLCDWIKSVTQQRLVIWGVSWGTLILLPPHLLHWKRADLLHSDQVFSGHVDNGEDCPQPCWAVHKEECCEWWMDQGKPTLSYRLYSLILTCFICCICNCLIWLFSSMVVYVIFIFITF